MSTQINAPTADQVNIECNTNEHGDLSTCLYMEVFCPSNEENICNILGEICNDLEITIKDSEFADNYLNVDCVTNDEDASGITVSCNNQDTVAELFYNSD